LLDLRQRGDFFGDLLGRQREHAGLRFGRHDAGLGRQDHCNAIARASP
jgi:hypothetical protein